MDKLTALLMVHDDILKDLYTEKIINNGEVLAIHCFCNKHGNYVVGYNKTLKWFYFSDGEPFTIDAIKGDITNEQ